MVFFLQALFLSFTAVVIALSSIVLAFVLNANLVPYTYLISICGAYAFALSFLVSYPLIKLTRFLGTRSFDQKEVYGGTFARLRK